MGRMLDALRQIESRGQTTRPTLRPIVPEGHPSLEAFEAAITDEERTRLPRTLEKLAMDGVERIYQVRRHDLAPHETERREVVTRRAAHRGQFINPNPRMR